MKRAGGKKLPPAERTATIRELSNRYGTHSH